MNFAGYVPRLISPLQNKSSMIALTKDQCLVQGPLCENYCPAVLALFALPFHGILFDICISNKSIDFQCNLLDCEHSYKRKRYSKMHFGRYLAEHEVVIAKFLADQKTAELNKITPSFTYWPREFSLPRDHPDFAKTQLLEAEAVKLASRIEEQRSIFAWNDDHNFNDRPTIVCTRRCTCIQNDQKNMAYWKNVDGNTVRDNEKGKASILELGRCKPLRGFSSKEANMRMKNERICATCKSEQIGKGLNLIDYKMRYDRCYMCRLLPTQGHGALCISCNNGIHDMKNSHALFKTVFVSCIKALSTTFDCSVDVHEEKETKAASATCVALNADAVVTIVAREVRHMFMVEFQSTHKEDVSRLVHKFNSLAASNNHVETRDTGKITQTKNYLVCVNISDKQTNPYSVAYELHHKFDIIRSWMLVAMQNPEKTPRYSYWQMFYEKYVTNGKRNGRYSSPHLGAMDVGCCEFLKYPLYLNSAPNGDTSDWQYCCDMYTVPMRLKQPDVYWEQDYKEIKGGSRHHLNLIAMHSINTCGVFKQVNDVMVHEHKRHCMELTCESNMCKEGRARNPKPA